MCRHTDPKTKRICTSVKFLMLHVRDCPGTTSTNDICPYPWCRKTKHLLYHLVSCENPDQCKICTPEHLTPQLKQLKGLSSFRRKKRQNTKPPSLSTTGKLASSSIGKNSRNQSPQLYTTQKGKKGHTQHVLPSTKKVAVSSKKSLAVPSPIPTPVQSTQHIAQNQSTVPTTYTAKKRSASKATKVASSVISQAVPNRLQANIKPPMKTANPILLSPEKSVSKVKNPIKAATIICKPRPPPPANPLLKPVNANPKPNNVIQMATPSGHVITATRAKPNNLVSSSAHVAKPQQVQVITSKTQLKPKVVGVLSTPNVQNSLVARNPIENCAQVNQVAAKPITHRSQVAANTGVQVITRPSGTQLSQARLNQVPPKVGQQLNQVVQTASSSLVQKVQTEAVQKVPIVSTKIALPSQEKSNLATAEGETKSHSVDEMNAQAKDLHTKKMKRTKSETMLEVGC